MLPRLDSGKVKSGQEKELLAAEAGLKTSQVWPRGRDARLGSKVKSGHEAELTDSEAWVGQGK